MHTYRKIQKRYKQFRSHPVTKHNPFFALLRYSFFNIKALLINEQTIKWIENLKFYARKGDAGLVGNIYFGLYEFEESIFLLHFMEQDDIFLDIGANLGHYSLLLSGIKACQSIAVEPVPKTYKQLLRNIELNNLRSKIETHQMGVSEAEGKLFFSTDKNTMDRVVPSNYKNSVAVQISTIDALTEDKAPIAMKLDVEGYEYFALKGANKLLASKNLKIFVLELNKSGEKYGIQDVEIFEKLLGHGFKPFEYNCNTRNLTPLKTYNVHKFNTLFIKNVDFVANRLQKGDTIKIRNKTF